MLISHHIYTHRRYTGRGGGAAIFDAENTQLTVPSNSKRRERERERDRNRTLSIPIVSFYISNVLSASRNEESGACRPSDPFFHLEDHLDRVRLVGLLGLCPVDLAEFPLSQGTVDLPPSPCHGRGRQTQKYETSKRRGEARRGKAGRGHGCGLVHRPVRQERKEHAPAVK